MSVDSVYKYIVFDVIRNIKSNIKLDSEGETVEEGIIDEIQTMWLDRLLQAGAITNEPDETTQVSQSVQQQKNIDSENVRNTLNNLIQLNSNKQTTTTTTTTTTSTSNNVNTSFGAPQPYMAPRENIQPSPSLNSNNNNNSSNNLPSSLRSIMNPIPQNDGTLDTEEVEEEKVEQDKNSKEYIDDLIITGFLKNKFNINGDVIPQNDGNDDDDDDDLDDDEGNNRGGSNSNNGNKDDDDLLGSDLDDDEDDDPDPIIDHYVLCQYEKVSRIKNKRKCNFKDGIMHLNGKDSLFNKANGEMVWL